MAASILDFFSLAPHTEGEKKKLRELSASLKDKVQKHSKLANEQKAVSDLLSDTLKNVADS